MKVEDYDILKNPSSLIKDTEKTNSVKTGSGRITTLKNRELNINSQSPSCKGNNINVIN